MSFKGKDLANNASSLCEAIGLPGSFHDLQTNPTQGHRTDIIEWKVDIGHMQIIIVHHEAIWSYSAEKQMFLMTATTATITFSCEQEGWVVQATQESRDDTGPHDPRGLSLQEVTEKIATLLKLVKQKKTSQAVYA